MQAVRIIACVFALIGVLYGCGQREKSLPSDVSNALTEAYNKDDAEACTALYTNDGAVLPQGAPTVIGKGAILKMFKSRMSPALQYATSSTVNGESGELAFDQGTYVIRNVEQGRDIEFGKYLNVFKKVDGHWRIFRTMWNMDTPGPGASPVRQLPEPTSAAPAPAAPAKPAAPGTPTQSASPPAPAAPAGAGKPKDSQ